ncbi:UDP-glucose/GDP-mannose dehydrogenase family protein [Petroclostridium sp. X23]|uniref:UDP-glucose dehydrogenase family protein n=1 Tax=Petroclostridium sp. X23 TaxID=3045146 RepID=UPI0024AE237A|nr:UDP-glucose/GDP-mannose dehydrogenase family protein [Petroclostridium sp. X23]WHH58354.1 UDP-glucose/GDP-mannose dehydrogenase family protein [Petroclostridium sp. X23]
MDICMIGTGYVGLVTGACLAHVGNKVICADVDISKIEKLNSGEIPIFEPGLEQLIKENLGNQRLEFTYDIKKAIESSTLIFISVGTPPCKDGSADLSYVFQAAHDIAASLNEYKIVVDKSTVPVGTAMKVKEIIQKNKMNHIPFSVVSNPEFLREGSAVRDIFDGDRIVIGVEDKKAQEIMKNLYEPFGVPIYITDIISAEMIKYASNAFLAAKISFINEIANICEKLGADVTAVACGMGMDKRIGPSFLNAGLGYGGSCFPKDVKAVMATAKENKYDFKILDAVMQVNDNQKKIFVQKVLNQLCDIKNPAVGVLGLAFKPHTDDIREAPSLYIIQELRETGIRIKAYDPIAISKTKEVISDIEYCSSLYEACNDVDAVLIVTEWDEFKNMNLDLVKRKMKAPLMIDGRNLFDPKRMAEKGFEYISVGRR